MGARMKELAIVLGLLTLGCREAVPDDPPQEEAPPPPVDGKCATDDHCRYSDVCMKSGCGLAPATPARHRCEESYMGPAKRCLCEHGKCVEFVRAR